MTKGELSKEWDNGDQKEFRAHVSIKRDIKLLKQLLLHSIEAFSSTFLFFSNETLVFLTFAFFSIFINLGTLASFHQSLGHIGLFFFH